MRGVTISAGYGTGGSVIAPAVAQRLDLPFVDRAISAAVLAELNEPEEGTSSGRSFADRILSLLSPLAGGVLCAGTDAAPPEYASSADVATAFRERSEATMRAACATGAVVLGRAGAAAFRHQPGILRVRLFGPLQARIAQGARIEGVDEKTACKRLREVDKSQEHYVRRLYAVDINDPTLFHVQLDSTVLSLDSCVDVIAAAYRSLTAEIPSRGGYRPVDTR
jgi:cytidylate kinase